MEARDSFCFPKNTKNPNPSPIGKSSDFVVVVRPGGFEPLAFRVGAERSIQLSYDRTICTGEPVQYSIAQPRKKCK